MGQGSLDGIAQHVLGQRYHDGAGRSRGRGMKRPRHHFADPSGLVDLPHGLGDAPEEVAVIDLLEGAAAALMARHLADEHYHRHSVLLCHVHGDRAVGGPGAATHHETLGFAGDLGFGDRHESGARLVPADDGRYAVRIMQGVEQGEVALARHAIDTGKPMGLERTHDGVGGANGHPPPSSPRQAGTQ